MEPCLTRAEGRKIRALLNSDAVATAVKGRPGPQLLPFV